MAPFGWTLWTWWNARADRKRNLPHPDGRAISDTERQIQTAANTTIRRAEQRFVRSVRPLEASLSETKNRIVGRVDPEWNRLVEKTGRRDVNIKIGRFVHFALLFVLTAGEIAFNLVAFNVFREPGLHTALMAGAVSVAIPLCAWCIGVWIRQWPEPLWATAVKILLVAGALIAVLFGVNHIRIEYLRELAPALVSRASLELAFFTINLVVLIGATLVTYWSYDPEPGFAETKRELDRATQLMHHIEGRIASYQGELLTNVEMAKEAGWQLMGYYRMVNRRRRERVPRYFDDDEDRNYRPMFVEPASVHEARPPVLLQAVEGGRR